ncbi:sphingomyelin phosphodiesterase-like [Onthophagus taurus]|uniref:sphingomyelin phosphodiesterase-like n=1 Tax=Onthophagus taurus TaxID=166361 RepID=UPI0039BDD479
MSKYFILLFFLVAVSSQTVNYRRELRNVLANHAKSGFKSAEFSPFLKQYDLNHAFRQLPYEKADQELCDTCVEVVDVAISELNNGANPEDIVQMIIQLCVMMNIESERVCEGAIRLNAEPVMYIAKNKPELNGNQVCGIVLGCPGADFEEWDIKIPGGNPEEIEKGQQSDATPIKVLQVTDTHYDPRYTPGSLGNCDEPLCCQRGSSADSVGDEAGYWGDYRDCDTPRHVILNAYEHVNKEHNIDYIYFTGDIIRHLVWATSIANNTDDMVTIFEDFEAYFPNTPLYPSMGNHEGQPVNQFAPPSVTDESVSSQWLYDKCAELWAKWLPEDAKTTIKEGGYYSALVKPGFRVVSFNSNIYQTLNWWLLYDNEMQIKQLQWLVDTLYQAEQNGEFVHILSHMPSAYGYLTFSRLWRRILERFSNTITAEFNGDSHNDGYVIFHHANEPKKPIAIAWNGGSLTTYSDHNYNYKVYTVDGENFEVLDAESWTFNLTEANLTPTQQPSWFKLYSFKDVFEMNDLSPKSMRELLIRMTTNHHLLQLDYNHRYRQADSRGSCNESCMKGNLCGMVRTEDGDNTVCDELMSMWS